MKHRISFMLDQLCSPQATWIIIALGLICRLALFAWLADTPLCIGDTAAYKADAIRLLQGESYLPYFPPGLPYYLAAFIRVLGDSDNTCRFAMVLLHIPFSLALLNVARCIVSRGSANLTLLIFAVYPSFIHLSVDPMSEMLAATLIVLLLACMARVLRAAPATDASSSIDKRSTSLMRLGPGVWGAALTLVRPASALLAGALSCWASWRARRPAIVVISLAILTAMLGVWLSKAHHMVGHFVPVNHANVRNLYLGNNPYTPLYRTWWFGSHLGGEPGVPPAFSAALQRIKDQPPVEQTPLFRQAALDHILDRPDLFLVRTFSRIRVYFAFDSFTGGVFVKAYGFGKLGGAGLLAIEAICFTALLSLGVLNWVLLPTLSQEANRIRWLLTLCILVYAAPYWVAFAHPRFHVPIVPLLALLGMQFLDTWRHTPPGTTRALLRASRRRTATLILALAFVLYIQAEWAWVMSERL